MAAMALALRGALPPGGAAQQPQLDPLFLGVAAEDDDDGSQAPVEPADTTRPQQYIVCRTGTRVHASSSEASAVVGRLAVGSYVVCATSPYDNPAMLRCMQPVEGWVSIHSPDGEVQLSPSGAEFDTAGGERWRYRVVAQEGALVRGGLELETPRKGVIPFQAIVEVTERCVNRDGLPRLRAEGGWISEILNPLSGQRGAVAELVPMERALRYRIVYHGGAVVRRTVELASAWVKTLEFGAIVDVVDKQFSNHPAARCLQRLKLADGSGWISLRLNKEAPDNEPIAVCIGSADLSSPQPYLASVLSAGAASGGGSSGGGDGAAAGSVDGSGSSSHTGDGAGSVVVCKPVPAAALEAAARHEQERIKGGPLRDDDTCVVCLEGFRTATLIHGDTGHIACCLQCARVLRARGDTCPVCRIPIDRVVQHFWA